MNPPLSRNDAITSGSAGVSPAVFGLWPKTFCREHGDLFGVIKARQQQSAGRRLLRPGRLRSPFSTTWLGLLIALAASFFPLPSWRVQQSERALTCACSPAEKPFQNQPAATQEQQNAINRYSGHRPNENKLSDRYRCTTIRRECVSAKTGIALGKSRRSAANRS